MADWIAQCGTDWFAAGYYDSYPNNIFLTVILAGIKKFTYFLGFSDGYFACIVAGVILVDISIFLITLTVKRLTKDSRLMVLTLILATIFLGFNPWIIIPYSDTYAVLFTSIVMYLYCLETAGWKRYLQWFGIVVTSMVGTYIKPTVIIALMAIVIVELLHISKERIREFLLKGVILAAAVIAVSPAAKTGAPPYAPASWAHSGPWWCPYPPAASRWRACHRTPRRIRSAAGSCGSPY